MSVLDLLSSGSLRRRPSSGTKGPQSQSIKKRPECRLCREPFSDRCQELHCSRCEKSCCSNCAQHEVNRLTGLGGGSSIKVCIECVCHVRSWNGTFASMRAAKLRYSAGTSGKRSIHEARQRITEGFSKEAHHSGVVTQVLSSFMGSVSRPSWDAPDHAAPRWKLATSCTVCQSPFNVLTNKKSQCCVCGAAVCSSSSKECAAAELLVYASSNDDPEGLLAQGVTVCVINTVGSPVTEPKVCKYLCICRICSSEWKVEQVSSSHDISSGKTSFLKEFISLYNDSMKPQLEVKEALSKYEQLVTSLGCKGATTALVPFRSNVQVLAKSQIDLNDLLGQHVASVMKMKALNPPAGILTSLLKAVVQAKCIFYQNSMGLYRRLRSAIEDIAPPDTLQKIQAEYDLKAVEYTYICVRQLGLEVLQLAMSSGGGEPSSAMKLAEQLAFTEEIIKAHVVVANPELAGGQGWQDYQLAVDQLIRERMRHHKAGDALVAGLRQRSVAALAVLPEVYTAMLAHHCLGVLERVADQLNAKASYSSFCTVKESLDRVEEFILQLLTEHC